MSETTVRSLAEVVLARRRDLVDRGATLEELAAASVECTARCLLNDRWLRLAYPLLRDEDAVVGFEIRFYGMTVRVVE